MSVPDTFYGEWVAVKRGQNKNMSFTKETLEKVINTLSDQGVVYEDRPFYTKLMEVLVQVAGYAYTHDESRDCTSNLLLTKWLHAWSLVGETIQKTHKLL